MSETAPTVFEPSFNRAVKVRSRAGWPTSNAGVLFLREVDHRLDLIASLGEEKFDPRRQGLVRYPMTEILRERAYTLAVGHCPADEADLLAHDPEIGPIPPIFNAHRTAALPKIRRDHQTGG